MTPAWWSATAFNTGDAIELDVARHQNTDSLDAVVVVVLLMSGEFGIAAKPASVVNTISLLGADSTIRKAMSPAW